MGCRSPSVRLPSSIPCPPISFTGSDTPSQLFSQVHQGDCVGRCSGKSPRERSSRASSFGPGLLQSPLCHPQSHWGLEACDRSLTPQPVRPGLQVSHGDCGVGSPISSSGRLDGVTGSPGCLPSGSGESVISALPEVLREGSVLQFRALCFSLLTAPQVFTWVMAPVSVIMHRYGFHILRYLDDWLVLGS